MVFQSDQRLKGYSGARAVIIGGLGLIGSAIARRLVLLDAEVLLIDSMIPEYGGNLANIADIRDRVTINIADIRGGYGLPPLAERPGFPFQPGSADESSRLDVRTGRGPRDQLHGTAAASGSLSNG